MSSILSAFLLLCVVIPVADKRRHASPFWAQVFEVLVAFDRFVNAGLGGSADETLSSRAHRMRVKGHRYWGWTANVIDAMFIWQPGHCRLAFEWETARLANPPWGRPEAQPYFPPGVDPNDF